MIKTLPMLVIAGFAMTTAIAYTPAQAEGFFESIFGSNKDQQAPEITLQAPFADKTTSKAPQSKLMEMYGADSKPSAADSDLSTPHRNEKQIVEWTTEIVSQAMTIQLKSYNNDFKKISGHFTPFALQEYQAYLQKTNMMNVLSSNGMRLQTASDADGSVIKEGKIETTYHWLVQVPLMTSFYKDDIDSVDKNATAQNQNLLVQVQVGRVAPKNNADIGLVIERWSVSSNSSK